MALKANTTYQIIDSDSEYLTDSGTKVVLEGDNSTDQQIWATGSSLSNTTLVSGAVFLCGEAADEGKVTCVTSSSTASNWKITGDDSNAEIELLDSSGKSLSPVLYLVPMHDQKGAKVSKNKQTWKFNPKPTTGSGGTS